MDPDERFIYQAPTPDQVRRIQSVREELRAAAIVIESLPMDPRCKALALTKLEECSMWANKGIVFEPVLQKSEGR